jgi:hypothetical protein
MIYCTGIKLEIGFFVKIKNKYEVFRFEEKRPCSISYSSCEKWARTVSQINYPFRLEFTHSECPVHLERT